MIELEQIRQFYPALGTGDNIVFAKNILKEYIELMVLDYMSTRPYFKNLTFIGGTNLRLVKGINRFSEDLDFDIKNMNEDEFKEMTTDVVHFLASSGLPVEIKDKDSSKLSAFRRNIYFPSLLYSMGLSGHKEERFLLKIEAQDQGVDYSACNVHIRRNGFFIPINSPSDDTLLSMKLSALLSRAKGRDFYDAMFLWSNGAKPDFNFLSQRANVKNMEELRNALDELMGRVDLGIKKKDFLHLIFNPNDASRIERFPEFVKSVIST